MERFDVTKSLKFPPGLSVPPSEALTLRKMQVDNLNTLEGDYTGYTCKSVKQGLYSGS